MKKLIIFWAAITFISPINASLAQDDHVYVNARFSYSLLVPAEFKVKNVSQNGDGQTMTTKGGNTALTIWGNNITEGSFEQEIRQRIIWDRDDGWNINYQRIKGNQASYSGVKLNRIFYQRTISVCDDVAASFRLEYDAVDKKRYDPIINLMVKSLRQTGECDCGCE